MFKIVVKERFKRRQVTTDITCCAKVHERRFTRCDRVDRYQEFFRGQIDYCINVFCVKLRGLQLDFDIANRQIQCAFEGARRWQNPLERFGRESLSDTSGAGSSGFFPRVTSAIDDPTLVLAGYNDIFRSTNSGTSWTNEGVAGNWDLERCPSNSNRFYAAGGSSAFTTTGSMWVSTDKGLNWTTIS